MRFTQRAAILITGTVTGLAPVAIATAAAAPVSSEHAMAQRVKSCVMVTATIGVGTFPQGVAANPKTRTPTSPTRLTTQCR